jgi:hypothetical protein
MPEVIADESLEYGQWVMYNHAGKWRARNMEATVDWEAVQMCVRRELDRLNTSKVVCGPSVNLEIMRQIMAGRWFTRKDIEEFETHEDNRT